MEDLTNRCSGRLAGLFPPVTMINILPEIAIRAPRSPRLSSSPLDQSESERHI